MLKEKLKQIPFIVGLVRKYRKYYGVNWIKTLLVNIKTQEFNVARKLPIYGKLNIRLLSGKIIIINAPIRSGMIRIGRNAEYFSASKGSALLSVSGTLIFEGSALFSVDCTIKVSGTCILGDMVMFGSSVKLVCFEKIDIGKGSRIGLESHIFNTNFHFLRNVSSGKISKNSDEVLIGNFCWIGNRTTITKGSHLPNYSITGSNSLLNRDYTKEETLDYPVFAGVPAKLVGSGLARVFGNSLEFDIHNYFKKNPSEDTFQGVVGFYDESQSINLFPNG